MGRHKNTRSERGTRIPLQRSIYDMRRMMGLINYPGKSVAGKSNQTLEEAIGSERIKELQNKENS